MTVASLITAISHWIFDAADVLTLRPCQALLWISSKDWVEVSNRPLTAESYLDSMPSEFYLTGIKKAFLQM